MLRIIPKMIFIRRLSNKFNIGTTSTMIKTITKQDIEHFTEISGDTNPIHSVHGTERAIVHGALLNSLVSGVIGTKLPGPGTLVLSQNLNFPNKCFVDDVVTVTVELVELRKIIKVKFSCVVNDKVVLFGDAKLIYNKEH